MRKILLAIPEELLVEVDEGAKSKYQSRSEYIRYVLRKEVGDKYPGKIQELTKEDFTRFLDLDDS